MPERLKKILIYGVACPAFFLFAFVLGAYWTFPYDHLREYLIQEAEKDGETQLEIQSLEPSFLTGVDLEGVRYGVIPESGGPAAMTSIPEASVRISIFSLLGGTIDVSFDAKLEGGGTIEGSYAQSEGSTHVDAELANVDLARLGVLKGMGLPMGGRASGTIDLDAAAEAAQSTGSINLSVVNYSFADGQTPIRMPGLMDRMRGGLTLERMNLGNLTFRMNVERGVGTIQRFYADGEHADLRMTGTINPAHPLKRTSYNVLFRVKFEDAYRASSPRTALMFNMLDNEPSLRTARTADGALQVHLTGSFQAQGRSQGAGREQMPGVD